MYKFAHIADVHLGAQKYPELKKIELLAFNTCLDKCVEEQVDFIIIAGDLFHSNLPDLGIVKEAVAKLKSIQEKGIPIYIIYGSHDFSPNQTSIIDIITESGLMKKIFIPEMVKDEQGKQRLKLKFTTDTKTNAKLVGVSSRKIGLDKQYYEMLDIKSLEEEPGFKIFVFHSDLDVLPRSLPKEDVLKISYFPKGFDYYAGGDVHRKFLIDDLDEYGPIVYPGSPFAGYPRDLELTVTMRQKRGFFIVEFDEKIRDIKFNELKLADYKYLPFEAKDKNAYQLYDEILDKIRDPNFDVNNKIVIMKVKGKLTGGKTSDINFNEIKRLIGEKGAIHVSINHHALSSKEFERYTVNEEDESEIEKKLLEGNISNVNVSEDALTDKEGVNLALELIRILKESPKANEKKADYLNRILKDAEKILEM